MFGCLLSGFYLLRVYDVATATYVAVAINVAVAALAFALTKTDPEHRLKSVPRGTGFSLWSVYVAIALSGFCALGAEAIWTRILGLLFGASVYTFSIIVAVFLTGLGIGSGIGSLLCRISHAPAPGAGLVPVAPGRRDRLDRVQSLCVAPVLADRPVDLVEHLVQLSARPRPRVLGSVAADASVGRELSLGARRRRIAEGRMRPRLFAGIYAANTLGAIVGALGASLLLIAWVGSQRTEQVLIALSTISGLLLLTVGRWIFAAALGCSIDLHRPARFRKCSSLTAATPRPGSAKATSSMRAKA